MRSPLVSLTAVAVAALALSALSGWPAQAQEETGKVAGGVDCSTRPDAPGGNSFLGNSYSYEGDPGKFVHCVGGKAYKRDCPGGLHWNDLLKRCGYPYPVRNEIGVGNPAAGSPVEAL